MRAFFSTGEASGELLATALAGGMRALVPDARFEGIGAERMRANGFTVVQDTRGWASLGPVEALAKIPPLLLVLGRMCLRLTSDPPDVLVLVDFGAFNLRLARSLRRLGYRAPILYFFPPGAWLDREAQAREVAGNARPLTAFVHQRDFYESLGLPIAYFGHPLGALVEARPERPVPDAEGGTLALLPGSRRGELERHLGRLLQAARLVKRARPRARFVVSAADADAEATIVRALKGVFLDDVTVARGARAAFDDADAALVASGTAVLEAALREVPTAALYVIRPSQVPIAKRVWHGPFITLPNILLDREVVPEFLQDDATPENLARAALALLADPASAVRGLRDVRAALGPADALARCAAYAVALARGEQAA